MQEVKIGVSSKIERSIEIIAGKENIERETAIRKLIYEGIKTYLLNLYARGDISLSKVGELLNLSPQTVLDMARAAGIKTGARAEHQAASRKTALKVMAG